MPGLSTIAQSAPPSSAEWLQFGAIGGPFLAVVVWFASKLYTGRERDHQDTITRLVALVAQRDARIDQLEAEAREKDSVMQNKVLPALIQTAEVLNRANERERRRHESPGRRWDDDQ